MHYPFGDIPADHSAFSAALFDVNHASYHYPFRYDYLGDSFDTNYISVAKHLLHRYEIGSTSSNFLRLMKTSDMMMIVDPEMDLTDEELSFLLNARHWRIFFILEWVTTMNSIQGMMLGANWMSFLSHFGYEIDLSHVISRQGPFDQFNVMKRIPSCSYIGGNNVPMYAVHFPAANQSLAILMDSSVLDDSSSELAMIYVDACISFLFDSTANSLFDHFMNGSCTIPDSFLSSNRILNHTHSVHSLHAFHVGKSIFFFYHFNLYYIFIIIMIIIIIIIIREQFLIFEKETHNKSI